MNITTLSADETYNMTNDEIKKLTNLTNLDLSYNSSITDDGISMLTNLTHLDLSYQNSISFEGIKMLTNLTILNLKANRNESITLENLDTLPNLSCVYVNHQILKTYKYDHKYKISIAI